MSKKKHTMNIARCFLELRNDDGITDEEKSEIIDDIDRLVIALTINLSDCGSKEEYKVELLSIIEWLKIDE